MNARQVFGTDKNRFKKRKVTCSNHTRKLSYLITRFPCKKIFIQAIIFLWFPFNCTDQITRFTPNKLLRIIALEGVFTCEVVHLQLWNTLYRINLSGNKTFWKRDNKKTAYSHSWHNGKQKLCFALFYFPSLFMMLTVK